MAKPGSKTKRQDPEQVQTPPPPKVDESNPPETITLPPALEGKTITIKQPETLTSKTWLYHETEEPRIFPAESEIPAGWQRSPRFPRFIWSQVNETEWGKGPRAKWIKRERERKG